jgi:ferric-dicitrate binding protein FerR (iron transport regulator)
VDISGSLTIGEDSVLETTEVDGHKVLQVSVDGDETALYVKTMVRTTDSFTVEDEDGNERFVADDEGLEINNADEDTVFAVDSEKGAFMAAADKFTVDEYGAISAVGGKFIATDEGIGLFADPEDTENTFSVAADDGSIYAASGNFQVDDAGDITTKGTLSVSDGKFEVDENGAFRAADEKFIVDSDGAMSAADGKFIVEEDGDTFVGDKFSITAEDGSFSAAGGYFEVNDQGSISAANKKFVVNKEGNITKAGTISAANGTFLVKEGGAVSAAAGKFEVKGGGTVSAAAGKFEVKEGGEVSAAAGKFEVKEGGTVSAAAGKFEVKEGGEVSAAGGNFLIADDGSFSAAKEKFIVNEDGEFEAVDGKFAVTDEGITLLANPDDEDAVFAVLSEDGSIIAAGGDFEVDGDGNVLAESLTFNSDPEVYVDKIDQADATIIDGEVTDERKQTMATNATIAKTIGNLAALTDDPAGVTGTADVATVILTLSNNVETATGGEFDDEGIWKATVDNTGDVNDYEYTESEDIMDAINQVASKVGTAEQLTNTFNGVEVGNSVNSNISALNGTMGDITKLNTELKNLTGGSDEAPETFVKAFNNLDATLGRVYGLVESEDATTTASGDAYAGNLAVGDDTTVENHFVALDGSIGDRRNMASANTQINEASKESVAAGLTAAGNAIGDMDFSSAHYYTASGADANLSDAVKVLDKNIYRIDNDLRDLRHDFYRGMASMAAMTALVPNSRSQGNTSLSLGTGAYNGHTAMALGGFHYLTDNILLNAGAAWGDSRDMSYRLGITYSF